MNDHSSLHRAKANKEDEFYTLFKDVDKELQHYKEFFFRNKSICCPCDPPTSNFFIWFMDNKKEIEPRDLSFVHFDEENPNSDFRNQDWNGVDVIVTNPPFSLFREFLDKIMREDKKFLVIAPMNVITYKEVYTLIQQNKVWLGVNSGDMTFRVPNWYEPRPTRYFEENGVKYRSMGNIIWLTNLPHKKRNEFLTFTKTYNENDYQKYDNYDGIEVSKVADIPKNYKGVMGVPITFLTKYNPQQFEIVGFRKGDDGKDLRVNGKDKYFRILVKFKENSKQN